MARIKVQVPGGNFKSIQTGNSTVIQQIVQSQPTVQPIVPSYASGGGGGGVTSITGTVNEITASASTGAVTLSIASTYAGQTSITTLGTIGTGVWEGTAIGADYGGVPSTEGVDSGWVLTNQSGTPEWEASSGGGGVTSIAGTSNEIDVSASTGDVVVSIDSGYLGQTSITTLGTIGTGTWAGTAIAAIHGGTAQTSWTEGDILYASASNTLAKLAIGTTGEVLTVASGIPSWASAGGTGGTTETIIDQSGGASQSYSVPANAQWLRVICIGGGGGGGGGAKTTSTGSATGGGSGGASGSMSIYDISAADAGSALTIVFSNTSGGAGGGGATTAGAGTAGTSGSDVTVENNGGEILLYASGGPHGNQGSSGSGGATATASAHGNVFNGLASGAGSAGGIGNTATNLASISVAGTTIYGPTGGGGGAGASSASGNAGGAGGSTAPATPAVSVTGGLGGTAGSSSVNGGTGGTGTQYSVLAAAGGGGGGSAAGAYNGGNGGPGSGYGAGGGGGAGVFDSTGGNAGSGGQGGYAACIIIAFGAASSSAGANPSASVGLSAVDGSATTFLRSDGAPALSQAIAPTWTGNHTFSPSSGYGVTIISSAAGATTFKAYATGGYGLYGYSDAGGSGIANADPFSGGALLYLSGTTFSFYCGGSSYGSIGETGGTIYDPIAGAVKGMAGYDSGSFTGTLTNMTTTVTGTIYWTRVGPHVSLYCNTITGTTSTGGTMTLTGLPSGLQPTTGNLRLVPCSIYYGGANCSGAALLAPSSGTITLYIGATGLVLNQVEYDNTGFGNGIADTGLNQWSVTYSL